MSLNTSASLCLQKSTFIYTIMHVLLDYFSLYRLFIEKKEIKNTLMQSFSPTGLVPVTCAGVKCMFEFIGYSYQGEQEPPLQSNTQKTRATRSTNSKAGEHLSKNNCEQDVETHADIDMV